VIRATRIAKARWVDRCPLCRGLIKVGHQIGKTPVGWCHTECIIEAARKLVAT
jgi:hypothetical protein